MAGSAVVPSIGPDVDAGISPRGASILKPVQSNPVQSIVSRIFGSLALFSFLLMGVTMIVGLDLDLNARVTQLRGLAAKMAADGQGRGGEAHAHATAPSNASHRYQQLKTELNAGRGNATLHRLLGVASALGIILVSSIAVTYFVGTSRWCREVVDAYSLDIGLARESQALKHHAFPRAVVAMLTVVVISGLGAASDPGTGRAETAWWATPHLIAALAGLSLIAWCFFVLWQDITTNHRLIDSIVERVGAIRADRGLEV